MPDVRPGSILLAEPFMWDGNFRRAVIAIVENDTDGTVGFVINHLADWRITDLVEAFPHFEGPIGYGGPVATATLHYLHRLGDHMPDAIPISNNVWWGGDFERLKGLIEDGIADPHNLRFFLGYSGWSPGQLTEELATGSWLLGELRDTYLFGEHSREVWSRAMSQLGSSYGVIGQMPDEPLEN